jgi:hypothetical protein
VYGQIAILDYRLRPDGFHDLVLWDEVASTFDQGAENPERARSYLDLSAAIEMK